MPRTAFNRDFDPFLHDLLEEAEVESRSGPAIEWENGDVSLEDWKRLVVSPAWKELERQLQATLALMNGSWQTLTDMAGVRYLAGRAQQLDLVLRLPYDIICDLESQLPQPTDPEGEDE